MATRSKVQIYTEQKPLSNTSTHKHKHTHTYTKTHTHNSKFNKQSTTNTATEDSTTSTTTTTTGNKLLLEQKSDKINQIVKCAVKLTNSLDNVLNAYNEIHAKIELENDNLVKRNECHENVKITVKNGGHNHDNDNDNENHNLYDELIKIKSAMISSQVHINDCVNVINDWQKFNEQLTECNFCNCQAEVISKNANCGGKKKPSTAVRRPNLPLHEATSMTTATTTSSTTTTMTTTATTSQNINAKNNINNNNNVKHRNKKHVSNVSTWVGITSFIMGIAILVLRQCALTNTTGASNT